MKSNKKVSPRSKNAKAPGKPKASVKTPVKAAPKRKIEVITKPKPAPIKVVKSVAAKLLNKKVDDIQKLVHLLQVHQIELEHQNQELRLAQEELELSRIQYVNLFDFSPLPYFALNIDGVIHEVNLRGAKMLGTVRKKLVGKQLVAFITMGEREIFNSFIASIFRTQVKCTCELKIFNKDKKIFNVRLEGQAFEDPLQSEQKCMIAIIDLPGFKNQGVS